MCLGTWLVKMSALCAIWQESSRTRIQHTVHDAVQESRLRVFVHVSPIIVSSNSAALWMSKSLPAPSAKTMLSLYSCS